MMRLTVIYTGAGALGEFDDAIIQAFSLLNFHFISSGYYFETGERDLNFIRGDPCYDTTNYADTNSPVLPELSETAVA